ncbi:MAG: DNA-directed DNA polymerase [Methanolinea sp.]|nr:DNA-directed DNA polymerase [Methanolinea sp.]
MERGQDSSGGGRSGVSAGGKPGIRLSLTQIEYSNAPGGPIIHVFGRDEERRGIHLQVTGFRPYFYVPADIAASTPPSERVTPEAGREYLSIRGEKLVRLYTERPTDVREERERYRVHYEADIPFATRFAIDCGIRGGLFSPSLSVDYTQVRPDDVDVPPRVCMVDIECEDERGFPEPGRDAIICITAWDSYQDRYRTFISLPPGSDGSEPKIRGAAPRPSGCFDPARHEVRVCRSEVEMLTAFAAYIRETDPDILSGWNFLDFDLPYLSRRMDTLSIPFSGLSRLEGQGERLAIRGRAQFDLLPAYRRMHATQKESYRLDAVAEAELGDTKVRYRGTLSDLWRNDPCLLVEYNYKDVALCVAINEKNKIIEFYREIARYVGCPLEKTLNSSNVIDIFVLRKAHGKFVLPSKGYAPAEEFEGATVFDPSKGIRENVVVLDLKSLYPMAMMTINASPETKDPAGELRAPNGVRFKKQPDGLTRSIIRDLLAERDEKKAMRNTFPFGSPGYTVYDMQQNVIKVIMNTYYGVSGYARFRLYDREIGAAVTSVGRAIIEHTRRVIEGLGYHVIYGDTDSCMVALPGLGLEETIRTSRGIEAALNASYADFAKKELNADVHFFSIKFEKVYRRFFQAGKKKRYAGHLIWKEGMTVDEIDIVGFEIRRSDYPQITKTVQHRVIELILRGEGYAAVRQYLGQVIRDFRAGKYSLDEIGIPGGIGKELGDYQTDDAHVRGARYANEHLGMDFSRGSKPKRVYIRNVTARFPKTDVLCFEYGDQVPAEFQVDWEVMMEKTIRQPISRIIEALGWSWSDIDPSRTTLAQWGIG